MSSLEGGEIEQAEGSWTTTILITLLGLVVWLLYGKGERPVRFRRWYNLEVRKRCTAGVIQRSNESDDGVDAFMLLFALVLA